MVTSGSIISISLNVPLQPSTESLWVSTSVARLIFVMVIGLPDSTHQFKAKPGSSSSAEHNGTVGRVHGGDKSDCLLWKTRLSWQQHEVQHVLG